jgi:hypothetical protein
MLSTIWLEHIDISNQIHPISVALLQYRCRPTRGPQITRLGTVDITLKNTAAFDIFDLTASAKGEMNRINIQEPFGTLGNQIRWSSLQQQYLPSFSFSQPGSLFLP